MIAEMILHSQNCEDVASRAKNKNRAWGLRKRSDQAPQTLLKEWIGLGRIDGNLRQHFHLYFVPEAGSSQRIDAAMNRASTQPGDAVSAGFHGLPAFVQLQEDILRDFLRDSGIVEKITGDAVNQSLMLANHGFEIGLRHLPSQHITNGHSVITQ